MQHPYHSVGADDASTLGSRSLDAGARDDDASLPSSGALPRIVTAGHELESFCRAEISGGDAAIRGFPPTCLKIVRLMAGNHCCVDCGDEERGRLGYASLAYGSLLCKECAHRHVTMMAEESDIKSLRDDNWTFRSTLALLEGGNARMLDYVKNKPRWRPPKSAAENFPEDELAFKSIYLSKSAGDYRKNLAKTVDEMFHRKIEETREEDAAREALAEIMAMSSPKDPFQTIFEQNDVAADEIPGLFELDPSPRNSDPNISHDRAGGDARSLAVSQVPRVPGKGRRTLNTSLMKHEAPSKDKIKERINLRRSMNASIAAAQHLQASLEDSEREGHIDEAEKRGANPSRFSPERASVLASQLGGKPVPSPASGAVVSRYAPQSNRRNVPKLANPVHETAVSRYAPQSNRRNVPQLARRNSAGLAGEVDDASLQEHDDQTAYTSLGDTASYYKKLPGWERNNETYDDDRTAGRSYSSRARTPPQLGRYTRIQGGERH